MRKLCLYVPLLVIAALIVVLQYSSRVRAVHAAAPVPTPFAVEVGCVIPLGNYICTVSVTPSKTMRFVIETVSFSGQATKGQTVAANFYFNTGGTRAFVWLPVKDFGPSASAGTDVYVATLPMRLSVDPNGSINLEVSRNSSANAGQNYPYSQRLDLMGYLE